MTLYSPHMTIGLNNESALGTSTGTTKEFRWKEATFPDRTGNLVEQANLGHEHMADTSDRPLTHSSRLDDGINITVDLRKDNGSDQHPLVSFMESAGLNNVKGTDTQVSVYTSTTDFEITADESAVGAAGAVELNDGKYWPVLTAAYSTGPNSITPSMAIPSASLATNDYFPMNTFIPGMGVEVGATKSLFFTQQTRLPHTSSEDWNFTNAGCAMSNFGPLEFVPGGEVTIPMRFHVCKVDDASGALAASVFLDAEKTILIDDNCEFGYANASASGGIASTKLKFHKLVFDPGGQTIGNTATGAGSVGDTSAYFRDYDNPATITVEVDFAKDYYDEFQKEDQTVKYLHLIQPTIAPTTHPCFGLWMPRATLMTDGVTLLKDNPKSGIVRVELKYKASSANYGSDTSNDSRGNAPYYYAFD